MNDHSEKPTKVRLPGLSPGENARIQDAPLLALHLMSRHAFTPNVLACTPAELLDSHTHEHDGPGTIRNHDRDDLDWTMTGVDRAFADERAEAEFEASPAPVETPRAEHRPPKHAVAEVLRAVYTYINVIDAVTPDGDIQRRDALRVVVDVATAAGVQVGLGYIGAGTGAAVVFTAAGLPAGSIVATAERVMIKRVAHDGTPWRDESWVAAETYAVPMRNRVVQELLDNGTARVLRVGSGR